MTISGIGLPIAPSTRHADRERREQDRDRDDVDARRRDRRRPATRPKMTEPFMLLLCRCASSAATTSSTREAGGVGVGEHAGDERAQPPLVLARRVRLRPAWR